jgi:ParB/RepB/Spo0J family partition protein
VRIKINDILVTNPTQDIDPLQLTELAESLREQGQSHSIIVRPANIIPEGEIGPAEPYVLASGEKRLLAAIQIGWIEIEAEVREIDEDKGKEIRLHENLKRFNLPWWDQVLLVAELHALRQRMHGVAQRGRPTVENNMEKQGWSIRDTADELGVGIGPLSEDLSLARALEHDRALRNVKDKKTAIKLIRIAARRQLAEFESSLPTEFERDQVYFGDSATILSKLPEMSIDHCITDPPWIRFFDPTLTLDERTVPVFRELYRVLRPNAFVFIFCGLDDYAYYAGWDAPNPENPSEKMHHRGILENLGYQVANTPIVWHKENSLTRRGVRAWEYDRDFEFIIVATRGNPALVSSRRLSGVKNFPIVPPVKMIHANEKPVALIEELITDCSYEGNIIVDPFAGSGVLGVACKGTRRHYILCEREKKYVDNIEKRLQGKEIKADVESSD